MAAERRVLSFVDSLLSKHIHAWCEQGVVLRVLLRRAASCSTSTHAPP
jgi:hypothetical protein